MYVTAVDNPTRSHLHSTVDNVQAVNNASHTQPPLGTPQTWRFLVTGYME